MILFRQALRSVWRGRRSYLACVLLMAVGIGMFVSFNLLFVNISAAMEGLYSSKRFGDGFATAASIPYSVIQRTAAIPGIARAEGTIVADARVLREGVSRTITLRLNSFDPETEDRLNDFVLTTGSLPGEDGILLSSIFAEAGGISVGDTINIVIGGREYRPIVTGFAISPEYIYAIPDSGQLLADNETFGFAYITASKLGAMTGKTGSATNLSFLLEEGVSFGAVKPDLEELLHPCGLISLVERKDQISHSMLSQEVNSIGSISSSLPMMFILIAIIILYIMLKRIIEQERVSIGTLKAYGFGDVVILFHYLGYGGITGFAGGAAGILLGLLMTDGFTDLYLVYFNLPAIETSPDPRFLIEGMLLALVSGLFGAFMGARGILKLNPGEAMRPPAPAGVTTDLIGKMPFLRAFLASHGYMAVRNLARNKLRGSFVIIGVAFSFALTAFMASFGEIFDQVLLVQFTNVELYNLKISMESPTAYSPAMVSARGLNGVRRAEAMLEVPMEFRREHLKKSVGAIAVETNSRLYQIYDIDRKTAFPPSAEGVILSASLADALNAKRGDIVTMRTPYTGDIDFTLPVMEVINSNLGATAYFKLDNLWELLGIPPTVTGLIVDAENPAALKEELLDAELVSAVSDQSETRQIYTDLMDTYSFLILMMQISGAVVAFAIITNTASISLSERKREYATMRVLGMHPGEISKVVSFEYWILTLCSIPPGIVLTRVLKELMSGMIETDLFSLPVSTSPSSFLSAAILCLAAMLLSNWAARRKIARFDMVEVLKERE